MRGWFYLGLAGLIGAFAAWAICEPAFVEGEGKSRWGNTLMFPLMVILMCLGFGVAESIVERSSRKFILRGMLSLVVGAPLGFIFDYVANFVYTVALVWVREAGVTSVQNPAFWIARAGAWAVLGVAGGVAYGVVGRSGKKCLYGIVGGVLGAAVGGLMFDPISMSLGTAAPSRALGLVTFGAATGIAMGLVESALKNRWMFVTVGPLAGKQFILYKPMSTMGSGQDCDIYLFKDPSILPLHASIEVRGAKLWLSTSGVVFVNRKQVQQCELNNNDEIQIGKYTFSYQEKAK